VLNKLGVVSLLLAAIATPAGAFADDLVILNLRSVEGDDELASDLSGAIRHAASEVAAWNVSDREIPLAQMLLVHSCDAPTDECMREIAQSLRTDRILYGTVRRSAAGEDFRFEVDLRIFDSSSGVVVERVEDSIARSQTDIDQLRAPAARYVAQLSGAVDRGSIRVVSESIGASVLLDGNDAGVIGEDGEVVVEADGGIHTITVQAEGFAPFERRINVRTGQSTIVDVSLSAAETETIEPPGGGLDATTLVGVSLLGVSAVGVAITLVSWFSLCGLGLTEPADACGDSEPGSDPYRFENTPNPGGPNANLCDHIDEISDPMNRDSVRTVCDEATTWDILQVVGIVLAAGGLGGGLALLILGGDDDEESMTLRPSFDAHHAGFTAAVRY
jgi:hypothetical protein